MRSSVVIMSGREVNRKASLLLRAATGTSSELVEVLFVFLSTVKQSDTFVPHTIFCDLPPLGICSHCGYLHANVLSSIVGERGFDVPYNSRLAEHARA